MAYGDGPKFGMISDNWIYDIGDAGSIGDRFRIQLDIDKTKEIPSIHFLARFKAKREMKKNLKRSLVTIKWLRRFQAKRIILDEINKNSSIYGDQIKVGSKLSVNQIQMKIDEENLSTDNGKTPYESYNTRNYSKFVAFKNRVSRRIWEKFYIARFKMKAFRKYNKQSKRNQALIDIKHEIDYHQQLLQNHLFHNFNVCAINCGKISKENGFRGIFPDKRDYEIANQYISGVNNSSDQTKNMSNNTNQNSEKVNEKDYTKENFPKTNTSNVSHNVTSIKPRNNFKSQNKKIDSNGIELLRMIDDYNNVNHNEQNSNINNSKTR